MSRWRTPRAVLFATSLGYTVSGLTNISRPQGVTWADTHDANLNLTRVTDSAGQSTTYTYDANGRRSSATNRLGDRISMSYHEPSGFPASFVDELGNTTTFAYTAQTQGLFTFYNLTRFGYADGTSSTLTYDSAGNVLMVTDGSGKVWAATYNPRGQFCHADQSCRRLDDAHLQRRRHTPDGEERCR